MEENKPESIPQTSEEVMDVQEQILEKEGSDETRESDNNIDASFKVPTDVAFKKPVFIKPSKRVTPALPQKDKALPEKTDKTNLPLEEGSSDNNVSKPISGKSPAQQLADKAVPLPYKEPPWSGLPKDNSYSFEILKNGLIIGTIPLDKPFVVVGRSAQCDIVMEHPSLSRFHCVIQYRAERSDDDQGLGFYAYDLGSTHGTFQNKHRLKPHQYYRLHVGHMFKFGGSSRTLILQGPDDDQEPESELTVTELKAEAAKRAEKLQKLETGEIEEQDRDKPVQEGDSKKSAGSQEKEDGGIDWGMGEDAAEDEEGEGEEGGENPFATLSEELYLDDPKKTLRGWFEREGYDLPEYVTEDVSPGVHKCKVDLPIPGPGGGPLVAIVECRGRKKTAVIQCALEACRLLDRRGVLRQAKHESFERKRKDWAQNDYYDSDEDDFLDRTGDVQRKRLRRMKVAKVGDDIVETYDSLITKYKEVTAELSTLEQNLSLAEKAMRDSESSSFGDDDDDLDSFMKSLKKQVPDKHKRVSWKLRAVELRKEELRLRRLTNVARPHDKPELEPYVSKMDSNSSKKNLQSSQKGNEALQHKVSFSSSSSSSRVFQVHKAFLEEDLGDKKLKLSRLHDVEKKELKPIPYKVTEKKKKKDENHPRKHFSLPEERQQQPSKELDPVISLPLPTTNVSSISMKPPMGPVKPSTILSPHKDDQQTRIPREAAKESPKDGHLIEGVSKTIEVESSSTRIPTPPAADVTEDVAAEKSEKSPKQEVTLEEADDYKECEEQKAKISERLLGPSLPPPEFLKPTTQQGQQPRPKKASRKKKGLSYDSDDINYSTWVPPKGQTGDGRTTLNDKLGY